MNIAALIISVLSLIIALGCAVAILVQRFSTHQIEILDSAKIQKQMEEMDKHDKKMNAKIKEIENNDNWL